MFVCMYTWRHEYLVYFVTLEYQTLYILNGIETENTIHNTLFIQSKKQIQWSIYKFMPKWKVSFPFANDLERGGCGKKCLRFYKIYMDSKYTKGGCEISNEIIFSIVCFCVRLFHSTNHQINTSTKH